MAVARRQIRLFLEHLPSLCKSIAPTLGALPIDALDSRGHTLELSPEKLEDQIAECLRSATDDLQVMPTHPTGMLAALGKIDPAYVTEADALGLCPLLPCWAYEVGRGLSAWELVETRAKRTTFNNV